MPNQSNLFRLVNKPHRRLWAGALCGIGVWIALSFSQKGLSDPPRESQEGCRAQVPHLDDRAYLRALSLDLRGTIPSLEEIRELKEGKKISEFVEEWIQSEAFAKRAARYHRSLLWNNASNVRLVHFSQRLAEHRDNSGNVLFWYRPGGTERRRPIGGPCKNEAGRLTEEGRAILDENGLDGWVEVHPYWDPDPNAKIRVCAIDAQTAPRSHLTGKDCATRESEFDPGCGCGPNLIWCDTWAVHNTIIESFNREVEQRVQRLVQQNAPYTSLFSSRLGFVNGPIVHYLRHQLRWYDSVPLLPSPYDLERLPNLQYHEIDRWEQVELPEQHAGVLTSPVYLMRFQTLRSRAAHFLESFLCAPLTPPDHLPVADEIEQREPDVQKRAGCKYCHAILEPMGAYWGRWAQQGAGYLNPVEFPDFLPECQECARGREACSERCRLHYLTRALSNEQVPYLGMLRVFEFLRPEHRIHVMEGPMGIVRAGLADGRLTTCTVRRAAEWLLGRPIEASDAAFLQSYEKAFLESGLSFRSLVQAIVLSEPYRRVR
ncbi:MAG: DUF1585 domain-containing protein [Sandaracinaceae bacterium]|nr:DUF1585 domain-containing protein [Sandaracinaceae bacterium]